MSGRASFKLPIASVLAGSLLACEPSTSSPFVVNLTMSPEAQAALNRAGERVKVSATYYWRPASGGPSHDESEIGHVLGGYPILTETAEADPSQSQIHLRGHTRTDDRMTDEPGELRVLINVFSGRRVGPDNILDCGFFDGSFAVASRRGVEVSCDLL